MDLTNEIKEFLMNIGADLVGVASVDAFSNAPEGHKPTDYLPKAKSVVAIAYSLNRGPIKNLPKTRNEYIVDFDQANGNLNRLAHNGAKFLEKRGFTSIPFSADASLGDGVRLKGDLSNKHMAVASGLGVFGLNNLVLTKEFGSRVRFAGIVTEAELTPNQPITEEICTKCLRCINNCPMNALKDWEQNFDPQEGWRMDKEKCYHYIFVQLGGKRCGMCIASCPI